jgi:hypothetical protein
MFGGFPLDVGWWQNAAILCSAEVSGDHQEIDLSQNDAAGL